MQQGISSQFHIFKTSIRNVPRSFTPSAWRYQGNHTKLQMDTSMTEVLEWQYKHTVAKNWGGGSLQTLVENLSDEGFGMASIEEN